MKKILLGTIFLFLLFSVGYANGDIYNETILGKKCEVEDFSTLGSFRLPLSSNKNLLNSKIFFVKKDENHELLYINGKYYLESSLKNDTLNFLDDGKQYYGILHKENGKKVLILNGKEISEFEDITEIHSIGDYKFEKKLFEGKKENIGDNIICKNLVGYVRKLLSPKIRNFKKIFQKFTFV